MRPSISFAVNSLLRSLAIFLLVAGLFAATSGLASAQAVNVALNKPVTAETDVVFGEPANVVDGDYSTVWYSYQGNSSTISFIVDLENVVTVQGYRLQPSQTQDYSIFTSTDGVNWTQRYVESDWASWPDQRIRNLTVDPPYYQARYVRYVGSNFNQVAYVGVIEFEVLADPMPITYAVTATAGTGGTASCSPNPVVSGGSATCTATANAGYAFSAWTGDCAGQGVTCTLSNITSAMGSTASFTKTVQAVPTLSEWTMIILSFLLVGMTALGLRRG